MRRNNLVKGIVRRAIIWAMAFMMAFTPVVGNVGAMVVHAEEENNDNQDDGDDQNKGDQDNGNGDNQNKGDQKQGEATIESASDAVDTASEATDAASGSVTFEAGKVTDAIDEGNEAAGTDITLAGTEDTITDGVDSLVGTEEGAEGDITQAGTELDNTKTDLENAADQEDIIDDEIKNMEEALVGTPVLDENGNPVLDADGNPVMTGTPVLDENGNPVLDEAGNPVLSPSMATDVADANAAVDAAEVAGTNAAQAATNATNATTSAEANTQVSAADAALQEITNQTAAANAAITAAETKYNEADAALQAALDAQKKAEEELANAGTDVADAQKKLDDAAAKVKELQEAADAAKAEVEKEGIVQIAKEKATIEKALADGTYKVGSEGYWFATRTLSELVIRFYLVDDAADDSEFTFSNWKIDNTVMSGINNYVELNYKDAEGNPVTKKYNYYQLKDEAGKKLSDIYIVEKDQVEVENKDDIKDTTTSYVKYDEAGQKVADTLKEEDVTKKITISITDPEDDTKEIGKTVAGSDVTGTIKADQVVNKGEVLKNYDSGKVVEGSVQKPTYEVVEVEKVKGYETKEVEVSSDSWGFKTDEDIAELREKYSGSQYNVSVKYWDSGKWVELKEGQSIEWFTSWAGLVRIGVKVNVTETVPDETKPIYETVRCIKETITGNISYVEKAADDKTVHGGFWGYKKMKDRNKDRDTMIAKLKKDGYTIVSQKDDNNWPFNFTIVAHKDAVTATATNQTLSTTYYEASDYIKTIDYKYGTKLVWEEKTLLSENEDAYKTAVSNANNKLNIYNTAVAAADSAKTELGKAQDKVKTAKDIVDALIAKGVKGTELENAKKALEDAKDVLDAARANAATLTDIADAARTAYNTAFNRYTTLVNAENAAREAAANQGGGTTGGAGTGTTTPAATPVLTNLAAAPAAVTPVVIPDAPVALAPTPATAPATGNRARGNVADTEEVTVIDEEPVAQADTIKEDTTSTESAALATIEDEEPALADTMQTKSFGWWWLLIVAAIGGGSFVGYRQYKKNKEADQEIQ